MNEEVMIPKSYHDKVCEEIIRFKDKQFYDAVHLLDDGTLEIHVTDYKMVKRVLVEDDNNFGNLFCEDKADRPQEWIPCSERLPELTIHENEPFIGEWDNSEPVLIYHRDNKYQYPYLIAQCTNGFENGEVGWTEMEEANDVINVLAWMPLPEPWKGADDE